MLQPFVYLQKVSINSYIKFHNRLDSGILLTVTSNTSKSHNKTEKATSDLNDKYCF